MAHWTITVEDNRLAEVAAEIRSQAIATLSDAGELFKKTARRECPVSKIRTPGYVHLRETIDFVTDADSMFYLAFVQLFVIKNYAIYINNGTSRMPPRPFFDAGVSAVNDHYDEVVEKRFAGLKSGRYQFK